MRGSIGRSLSSPNNHYLSSISRGTSFLFQSSFSTSSSSGGGRGRGGVSPSSSFIDFTPPPGKSESEDSKRDSAESPPVGLGHGRGRGKPLSADPILHPFTSFVSQTGSGPGRGRGRVTTESVPPPPPAPGQSKQPIFIKRKDENEADSSREAINPSEPILHSNILSASALSGGGRGKPLKQHESATQMREENRHIRVRPQQVQQSHSVQLSQEEATKKAMGILSRRSESDENRMAGRGGTAGIPMGRGRGRGRGRGLGRGRGRRQREETRIVKNTDETDDFYLGDNADGEKFAKFIGPENMNKVVEGFEEMSSRLLPSPMDDAYLDALHTNYMIECEPEYLMGEFETNPDIDDKPPMPLRDALEKMKPFLMAYEGIRSQEEWEEVVEDTMQRVPLMQEIVDYYSGPDRITAKKQQEELERVAKTIPDSAPSSVKHFADRAVLSLQSNPGWGFGKKFQFMDKLVREVSQQYK